MHSRKWLIVLALAIMCIGLGTTRASAAVSSINNNFTVLNPGGEIAGGTNDVTFTWDGTKKTSVVASGQVSNAVLSSSTPFYRFTWLAHDVAIYGTGTYTVYAGCPARGPGCGEGTPITFTVGTGQFGIHFLFDWGGSDNIDVVNVWKPNAVFGPSPLYTGPDGTTLPFGNPRTVWSCMSSDWDGDGINGRAMVDGPFVGFHANLNINYVGSKNNNFTMLDPRGGTSGVTNDVTFTWNGTKLTSVAASGQVSNAAISSSCSFHGIRWSAHDVAIYGPGTYTVYADCGAGSPGCKLGKPITFKVGPKQIAGHMLLDWGDSNNIDVVNVWSPGSAFGPSLLYTGECGNNPAGRIWDWMSTDWDTNGMNGAAMVDGLFAGFSANFNVMGVPPVPTCIPANCDDNNACTMDTCNTATGLCVHTPAANGTACGSDGTCQKGTCQKKKAPGAAKTRTP